MKIKNIADFVLPINRGGGLSSGSTDVGDVSWVVPTMQCTTACWALGTSFHTWQVVSQGTMPIAHKGMLQAGKGIACTAIEAMKNPEIIEKTIAEHREWLDGEAYFLLIPEKHLPPKKADFVSTK